MNPHLRRIYTLFLSLTSGNRVDIAALKRCGINQLRCFSNTSEALALLMRQEESILSGEIKKLQRDGLVNLIVCSTESNDAKGHDFVTKLRSPNLKHTPPLILIGDNQHQFRNDVDEKFSFLGRPYGIKDLKNALAKVKKESFIPNHPVLKSFLLSTGTSFSKDKCEKIEKSDQEIVFEKAYALLARSRAKHGSKSVQEKALSLASSIRDAGDDKKVEDLLKLALYYDRVNIESCLLLAKVKMEEGNKKAVYRWMHRAGVIYLSMGNEKKAKEIFARLPGEMVNNDPFLQEIVYLLQDGNHDAAAEELIEYYIKRENEFEERDASNDAILENIEEMPLHELFSRVCIFTNTPEQNMRELCDIIEKKGRIRTAKDLSNRLFRGDYLQKVEPKPGFLDDYPKLQELLHVARFTFDAWRYIE